MIQTEPQTSAAGINAIKAREGKRLTAYKCPAGVWTIGFGHTGRDVTPGRTITDRQAENLLIADLEPAEEYLTGLRLDLPQYRFDALTSFIYNIGALRFSRSTMLRLLKQRRPPLDVAAQFMRWIYATGPDGTKRILPGLARRRYSEGLQFLGYPPELQALGYPPTLISAEPYSIEEIHRRLPPPTN